jgi:hypothetical protein
MSNVSLLATSLPRCDQSLFVPSDVTEGSWSKPLSGPSAPAFARSQCVLLGLLKIVIDRLFIHDTSSLAWHIVAFLSAHWGKAGFNSSLLGPWVSWLRLSRNEATLKLTSSPRA